MNFFEHQDRAHKRTKLLALLFVLAVIAIVSALYLVAAAVTSYNSLVRDGLIDWWDPKLLAIVSGITLTIIGVGSLAKSVTLRKGGSVVAQMLGGRPVPTNTGDPDLVKLRNVVEEMSIASGTPVPEIYVLPDEPGINAFAAGFTPGDAAIGVTRGSIEKLTRDELQGVIAHEFSHILNGDMRLNIRVMGLLNGILLIGLAGYFLLRSMAFSGRSSSRGRGGGGAVLVVLAVGLTMLVVGYVGVFFGRLIQAAVSRQREFLADASAVQFTRNPNGIAGALKKIGGFATGSRLESKHAPEAGHFFFGDGLRRRLLFSNLLATHPPLEQRIRAIDPSFAGTFAPVDGGSQRPAAPALGLAPMSAKPAAPTPSPLTASGLVDRVGTPTPEHIAQSAALLDAIPEPIKAAAREPFGAQAVVFALLLDGRREVMEAQLAALETSAAPPVHRETVRLAPQVALLDRKLRLPLVDIALAALRQHSRIQFEAFRRNVQTLIEADQKLELFEFTLQKILLRHLRRTYEPQPQVAQLHSLKALVNETRLLLATLAYAGHADMSIARAAYTAATARLGPAIAGADMPPTGSCKLSAFDYALDRLAQASPPIKQQVLESAATCVEHDGRISPNEAELLRAISDGLDCPMPPILDAR